MTGHVVVGADLGSVPTRDDGRSGGPVPDPGPAQELVVLVGLQGAGKSTWVGEHLAGTHAVVSKDHWPHARRRHARQSRVVAEHLAAGRSVVVDGTNPTPQERADLVGLARAAGVPARAVWLDVPLRICLGRNDAREGRARVPLVGVLGTHKRLVPPTTDEGFAAVEVVRQPRQPADRARDVSD